MTDVRKHCRIIHTLFKEKRQLLDARFENVQKAYDLYCNNREIFDNILQKTDVWAGKIVLDLNEREHLTSVTVAEIPLQALAAPQ